LNKLIKTLSHQALAQNTAYARLQYFFILSALFDAGNEKKKNSFLRVDGRLVMWLRVSLRLTLFFVVHARLTWGQDSDNLPYGKNSTILHLSNIKVTGVKVSIVCRTESPPDYNLSLYLLVLKVSDLISPSL
jgi:hypothetical protein